MRRIFQSPIFEGISEDAFYKRSLTIRDCPRNTDERNIGTLTPDLIHDHRFYIDFDENDNITKLVVANSGEKYSHFNLLVNNDGTYWAAVCYHLEKSVKKA